ncbi:MAG: hypothetical protein HKN27_12070 [Silicimonas sp.]|nr:hypothetical protein [Silicimonas sp.]
MKSEYEAGSLSLAATVAMGTGVMIAFLIIKGAADPTIVAIGVVAIAGIFAFERYYLAHRRRSDDDVTPVAHDQAG